MAVRIQIRRDTDTNWSTVNPILADGEQGVETNTGNLKLGNGVTPWNSLPYFYTSNQVFLNWQSGIVYTVNRVVVDGGAPEPKQLYRVVSEYTSGASIDADILSGNLESIGGISKKKAIAYSIALG